MRWGYSPSWAKKPFNLVNARQETLGEKPSFRQSLRCLIFADGWYEWSRQMNGKQPYFFHLDHKLFFFAGIYGEYNDENCCCIVTTEANEKLSDIHHRMPIIVDGRDADDWLSGDNYPSIKLSEMIKYYPVSSMVNSPIHDNEGCIRQI